MMTPQVVQLLLRLERYRIFEFIRQRSASGFVSVNDIERELILSTSSGEYLKELLKVVNASLGVVGEEDRSASTGGAQVCGVIEEGSF
jgi:hypothetical protein